MYELLQYFLLGYHSAWNKRVSVKHPSIWNFIRHLKDALAQSEVAIDSIRSGVPVRKQKKKWRVRNSRIKKLKQRYVQGNIDLTRFWNAVSHLTPNF